MASTSAIAPMDNGPTWSMLDAFLRKFNEIKEEQTPSDIFNTLFPFLRSGTYDELGSEMHSLKADFCARSHSNQDTMRLRSVVSFIFTSNAIENCGTATENDTDAIISERRYPTVKGEVDVASTCAVLRETYKPCREEMRSALELSFTVNNLKLWHAGLTKHDEGCNPGVLRNRGACTFRSKDGRKEQHHYPHHKYVETALPKFCDVVRQLVSLCHSYEQDGHEDAALIWFVVAAFAQFHFVTLHPFRDGNGRMCRLIAKLVLDCWMPVAIPMFPNKDEYFEALIAGQSLDQNSQADELLCVEPLFSLLMTTACAYLLQILRDRTRIFIQYEDATGLSEHDLAALKKHVKLADAEIRGLIESEQGKLGPYRSASFDIDGDVTVTLIRSPAVKRLSQVASTVAYEEPDDEAEGATRTPVDFDDDFA